MDLIGKTFIVTKTGEKGECSDDNKNIELKMAKSDKKKLFQKDAIIKGFLVFEDSDLQDEYMMIKYYKDKGNEIFMYLKDNYRFEGFFHETHIENLKSILESGSLLSRKTLIDRNIKFYDSADQNVLNTPTSKKASNYCRLYFKYGTPTNYRFNEKNSDMVYIVFDWDLLYEYRDRIVISNGNNASEKTKRMYLRDFYKWYNSSIMDWDHIFSRASFLGEDYEKKRERNAEVDVKGEISTKFIKKIIFRSQESFENFKQLLKDDDSILLKFGKKMVINPNYFM